MAEKKSTVDTWKKKKWYDVFSDSTFDEKKIAETITSNQKNLIGRIVKKGLNELTGNIRDSSFEVSFKINKITGARADTMIAKFESKPSSLRRMIRRQKSKIEPVFYATTKDGTKLKLKVLAITGTKYATPLRAEARKAIVGFFTDELKEKTTKECWQDIVFQNISERCKSKLVKLGYVNKVLVAKATVV